MNNKLMNVADLGEALGISRAHIYTLIKKGLPVIKIGNNTRFDYSEVLQWIKGNQQNG